MPANPQPSPTRPRRRNRVLAAISAMAVATAATALVLTTSSAGAAVAATHDPVIMVPGMTGSPANMDPMKRNLQSNGWSAGSLFTWTDSSSMTQDLAAAARELGTKVDQVRSQTGASKVVLATWSASTLAARYYIKNLGGGTKVSQYIAFAGPQHGTTNNGCRQYVSCQQFATADTPFLRELNSGTEVPFNDTVSYLTLRSSGDYNAAPPDTAMLAGADENFLLSGPMAPSHFTIISDNTALAKMRSFIIEHEGGPTETPSTTPTTPPSSTTPPVGPCFSASNYAHVQGGRAHSSGTGYALANGSNQNLGLYSLYAKSKLRQTGNNFYVLDNTCP